MSEQELLPINGFGKLFEKVTVMYASDRWAASFSDVSAVLGTPKFTDNTAWAAWNELSVSDEVDGPPWSLLARTSELNKTLERALALGWQIGDRSQGAHETRVTLLAPSGLTVIAYTPTSGA
ncbi:hypothetical protein [Gordonia rubripertincta]|uniref:Uncharacterized protein n=1 Tax=Gordonia rubripertincta TaxID=36822 RepID=A0ABT4MZE1_GORRU|nr:hypothetical protein [Gordonia rubripertincta]MCZ4552368.1 hypothetical protein [Gordonia rubripertincta]